MERQELIKRIEALSPERLAEVGKFLESITQRQSNLDRPRRDRVLAEYAQQYAGTPADLDADLETAAVEHLLQQTPQQ